MKKRKPIAREKSHGNGQKNPTKRSTCARNNLTHSNIERYNRSRVREVVYLVRARCDFLTEFSFGGVPDDEYEFVRSPPTQKKRKKKSYREQRHRLSSARFFAGREGHDRSARGGFHRALLLQAFGLGDRRFRGHVKGGLNDRSHFICVILRVCCYEV